MKKNEADKTSTNTGNDNAANTNKRTVNTDLPDSPQDEAKMQPEEVTIDLPDVKDIPGQEFIHPPIMESFADTTIASDDEEGVGLFDDEQVDDEIETEMQMGTSADVSDEERTTLERADSDMPSQDDINLRRAELDKKDNEGVPLNEGSLATDVSGADLDTTIVDADNRMENIGAEDEENNTYSLGSDSNDNLNEGTP